MTSYKTQSANVLNEADRFERILDWQLFCNEQERLLYVTTEESSWMPGDPLMVDPRLIAWGPRGCDCRECVSNETTIAEMGYVLDRPAHIPEGYTGNTVRFMMEEFEDGWFRAFSKVSARCEPCQVSWSGQGPCWMCGETPEREKLPTLDRAISRLNEAPEALDLRGMVWGSRDTRLL